MDRGDVAGTHGGGMLLRRIGKHRKITDCGYVVVF